MAPGASRESRWPQTPSRPRSSSVIGEMLPAPDESVPQEELVPVAQRADELSAPGLVREWRAALDRNDHRQRIGPEQVGADGPVHLVEQVLGEEGGIQARASLEQ